MNSSVIVLAVASAIAALALARMLQIYFRLQTALQVPSDVTSALLKVEAGTMDLRHANSRDELRELQKHYPGILTNGLWSLVQAAGLPLSDVLQLLDRTLRRNLAALASPLQLLGLIYKAATLVGLMGTLLLVSTSLSAGESGKIGEALASTGLGVLIATAAAAIEHMGRVTLSRFSQEWVKKLEDAAWRASDAGDR